MPISLPKSQSSSALFKYHIYPVLWKCPPLSLLNDLPCIQNCLSKLLLFLNMSSTLTEDFKRFTVIFNILLSNFWKLLNHSIRTKTSPFRSVKHTQ